MRLGLGSYACAWQIGVPGYRPPRPMDVHAFIRQAAELALDVVQIADNLPLEDASPDDLAAIRDTARQAGMTIELGMRGFSVPRLRQFIEIAGFLQASLIRLVVGTAQDWLNSEQIVSEIVKVVPDLNRDGVSLAVENHDSLRASELIEVVSKINSARVGICLDTANSFGAGEGTKEIINSLAAFAINVHLKDFSIRRKHHQMGFEIEGAAAGEGMLDIPYLLKQLSQSKHDPNIILELWPPEGKDLESTLELERQWCLRSVRYLSALLPIEGERRGFSGMARPS